MFVDKVMRLGANGFRKRMILLPRICEANTLPEAMSMSIAATLAAVCKQQRRGFTGRSNTSSEFELEIRCCKLPVLPLLPCRWVLQTADPDAQRRNRGLCPSFCALQRNFREKTGRDIAAFIPFALRGECGGIHGFGQEIVSVLVTELLC